MTEQTLHASVGQTTRGRAAAIHIDGVSLALVLALLLLGLVMVTSASISIASQDTGNAFYFLERQLLTALVGTAGAVLVFCFRMERWERLSQVLLVAAARGSQLPGLGAGPGAGVDIHRELRGTAAGGAA